MPAIYIRQLENFRKLTLAARTEEQRDIVAHHANLILRASEETVPEAADRSDVLTAYKAVIQPVAVVSLREEA